MKIDAHQHFWQFDPVRDTWISAETMPNIRRDFMPDDIAPTLKKHGFDGCIAVQADQSETETSFLLDLAAKNPFIKGVVGWVDLTAKNCGERLDYWRQFERLKGFRHILQAEEPEFMLNRDFINGVRLLGEKGFTYDILITPKHLPAVKIFLQQFGNQPFVIDHLAKPYIKKGMFSYWSIAMRAFGRRPNVYCKISGLVTEADWQNWREEDFTPYLDVVFEAFGPERLLYGSDWPVCLLASSYEKQLEIIENYVAKRVNTEGGKLFGENAQRFYKLQDK